MSLWPARQLNSCLGWKWKSWWFASLGKIISVYMYFMCVLRGMPWWYFDYYPCSKLRLWTKSIRWIYMKYVGKMCISILFQYSGTNAEFTKADTVIFRTDLYNMTTGRKEFNFKRTLKYDSKWLDSKYIFRNIENIFILISTGSKNLFMEATPKLRYSWEGTLNTIGFCSCVF